MNEESMRIRVFFRCITAVIAFASLICLSAGMGTAAQRPFIAVIDPAHGGPDTGVVSDSFKEKEFNLSLGLLIREEARKGKGIQIVMTRTDDKQVSTAEKVKVALNAKADCFISLHANAGFGSKARGYEIYYPGFNSAENGKEDSRAILKDMVKNKSLNDSVLMSQSIQAALEKVFPRKGRGLRDAPVPALAELNVPGLVLEVGFAVNPEDRKILTDKNRQRALAASIVRGIEEYAAKTR